MTAEDGLRRPQRQWALATVMLTLAMSVLDTSATNVALPSIAAALQANPSHAIWVINAFQLSQVVALLPFAALGEIHGYRRVYLWGLVLFAVASAACTFADSLTTLALARTVQGFGSAAVLGVNIALVRHIVPRHMLGRTIGLNSMVVAIASTVGPSYSGFVLGLASWPWLFALNVPLCLLALVVGARSLPETARESRRYDRGEAALTAAGIGFTVMTLVAIGQGLAWQAVAAFGMLGALSLAAILRRLPRQPAPMLPLDLLRMPLFGLTVATSVASFAGQTVVLTALPFRFHDDFGFSPALIGLLMVPWPLALAVMAPVSGHLSDRYPAGWLCGAGLLLLAGGMVALGCLPDQPGFADIVWRMALCGLGFGLFQTPNNRTLVTAPPPSRGGAASGMLSTARLFGQSIGAALAALMLRLLPDGGSTLAMFVAAGFAICGAVISVLRVGSAAKRP